MNFKQTIIKAEKNKEKEPKPRVRFRFLLAEGEGLSSPPKEQKEPGRRLDDFGRDAPSHEPAGFLILTQQKRRSAKALRLFWRKVRDYLRRRRNRKKELCRRLDDFGRSAPSREPAGFLTLTQQKRRSAKALRLFWRKVRDYLRRRRNRKKELCRRLDDFGRSAPSREPAGFLTLTQQKGGA